MDSPPADHLADSVEVSGWDVSISSGTAGAFHHAAPLPDPTTGQFRPAVWIHRPAGPALVLGSTQTVEMLDEHAAAQDNVEICKRHSGGGLVFIDPATDCWIDLIVPCESRLWNPDIGKAFQWAGQHWGSVLSEALGIDLSNDHPPPLPTPAVIVHQKPTVPASDSAWCFGQVGHGEVTFEGRKIIGLSQRRTRRWTRIQGIFIATWPVERLKRYVDPERLRRQQPGQRRLRQSLDPSNVAAGIGSDYNPLDPGELASRFVATIPAP